MVTVTIKGEKYEFDNERYPLSEAIELERGIGMPFGVWRAVELPRGSVVAMAGFVWLVLKRAGQDVALDDIVTGAWPLNTEDVTVEKAEGPTSPGSKPGETSGSPS